MDPESPAAPSSEQVAAFFQKHRTGLVTLVFTDLVDSVALLSRLGDQAGATFLQRRRQMVRVTLQGLPEGEEIETAGDSFLLAFAKPSDAVRFALQSQARLRSFSAESNVPVQERIGIHLGEVVIAEKETAGKAKDFYGIQLATCFRVMSLAQGGQVLLTRGAFDSARQVLKGEDIPGIGPLSWVSHGPYLLKGIEEAVEVCEVGEAGQSPLEVPKTSDKAQRQVRPDEEPVLGWRPAVGQEVPDTKWVLEEKLGEGGFGEVWRARHEKLNEQRVFKFCFRADRVRSLKREVTLFRLLKERAGEHPHIVKLHDIYFDQPPFYLEEEYVAGKDLRSWCEAQGGLENVPLEVRLEIVAQAAEALQAAHDAGIIHRDVKPGNILVSGQWSVVSGQKAEGTGEPHSQLPASSFQLPALSAGSRAPSSELRAPVVKLTDFGIGQVVSAEVLAGVTRAGFTQTMLGSTGSGTGTTMYLAPEIIAGNPATTRSDTYSLGVVLYQLLAGDFRRPVTGDWAEDIHDSLLRDDLKHCLAGRTEDRFTGAGQLATSLRQYAQRQAELARHERSARQVRRRRRVVRLAFAVTGILLLVSLGLAYGLNQARRDRDRALLEAYVADTRLAGAAVQAGNLGQAMSLLRRHIPQAGAMDLRGVEWRYLWQRCRGEQVVTFQHPAGVNSADISPDGGWIVSRCQDQILLWQFEHPDKPRKLSSAVSAATGQSVAFSPAGRLLATASADKIELWDTSTWKLVRVLAVNGAVLAFSGDGGVLAAFGTAGVQTWRTATWAEQVRLGDLEVRSEGHHAVALNHDGTLLAVCVEIWTNNLEKRKDDLAVWRLPQRSLVFRAREVVVSPRALAFSPDGRWLAVGGRGGAIHLWDLGVNRQTMTWAAHQGLVQGLTFTRDHQGQKLVSAGSDQSLRFWIPGQDRPSASLRGHRDEILSLRASADGRWLVSASMDGTVRAWHASGQADKVPAHPIPPNRLMSPLSPDGRRMFTTNPEDWSFEEWDLTSGERLRRVPMQATNLLWGLAHLVGPDKGGQSIERNVFIRDWEVTAPEKGEPGRVISVGAGVLPWGFGASTVDGTVLEWDHETGALMYSNRLGAGPLQPMGLVTLDQQWIALAEQLPGWRFPVFVGNVAKGRLLGPLPDYAFGPLGGEAAAPDGSRIVYPSPDGWFVIWDRVHGVSRSGIPAPKPWRAVAMSPDKNLLAVTAGDAAARVWDLRSSKPVTGALVGHFAGVTKLGFSADGRTLITYSWDRTARLWNVATGREILSELPLNSFLCWHPWIQILSQDNNAVIEPEGEDRLRVIPLPGFAEIDAAEKAQANAKLVPRSK